MNIKNNKNVKLYPSQNF